MELASPRTASCRRASATPAFVLSAGLGAGGQPVANCRKAFITSVELLVELASLQTAFITLDIAIKQTNRRVNALDNVVRPRLENTIAYIKVHTCLHRWTGGLWLPAGVWYFWQLCSPSSKALLCSNPYEVRGES